MKFDQPADLNKYVDSTIPLTWAVRWWMLKPALPLLLSCGIILMEMLLFRLWLADESLISKIPLLLLAGSFPTVLTLAVTEIETRLVHHRKRMVELRPKGISISPAGNEFIPWQNVQTWRVEPLADSTTFLKWTIEYSRDKKGELRREWAIILRRSDHEPALLSELEYFRQLGANAAPIVRLPEPRPVAVTRTPIRPMIALGIAFWLFVHGIPLLAAGLLPERRNPDEGRRESRFSESEIAKLGRTAMRFFDSSAQLRRFALITGAGMTALGVGVQVWGLASRKKQQGMMQKSREPQAAVH